MKKLLLVDGSSFLYRAFHAMPDMRNADGFPTGAIYGVLNMLRKLRADYPADYSLCVFDAKGKTFRDDWYPEYKATRAHMPDDLALQIEPLHQLIAANGWHIAMIDGVEADDVIGTLTSIASRDGVQCIVATGDKDLAQLVNEQVFLINTMNNEKLDVAGVIEKFGVPPNRIIDLLTLTGDTVDNVPGVAKVGPKTAVKWLTQYGSLDEIIAHASEVGGVVGQNLRDALDWLPQARRLITVKCDVALAKSYDQLTELPLDVATLRELYQRFGFRTWLREVGGAVSAPSLLQVEGKTSEQASLFGTDALVQKDSIPTLPLHEGRNDTAENDAVIAQSSSGVYECILTDAQLDTWLAKLLAAELVCVDTETTGLDTMTAQLVGISFAVTSHEAAYLPLAHVYPGAPDQLNRELTLQKLKPWLESATHKKLGQNLKYDQHIFANHCIALAGIAEDTLLQSYVLESHKPHDMDNLALRHLDVQTISYIEVVGKGAKQICFDQVDLDIATKYAAEDADITLQLHQALAPQVMAQKGPSTGLRTGLEYVYRDIEMPSRQVLYTMERNGVLLDSA
ncbi:MAG: 5'-3' exonuclease H3TH domain-containing protein, partial [Gallionella sp.]